MSPDAPSDKQKKWQIKASKKNGIVPYYFEVFPNKVKLECGNCRRCFQRPLIIGVDEPTFACPDCGKKNWVPITYDLK